MSRDKEINELIGIAFLDRIPTDWSMAGFRVKYASDASQLKSWYKGRDSEQKNIFRSAMPMPEFLNWMKELHEYTHQNGFTPWNVFKFTVHKNGDFETEYIWDQEFQDEVDEYKAKYG